MTMIERFEEAAKAKGMTITLATARAGLSTSHLYKLKRGEVKPRPATVKRLAEVVGLRPSALDPEMFKETDEALALATQFDASATPSAARDLGFEDEELVFVGMSAATLTVVAPLLNAMQPDTSVVSGPLVNGLCRVARMLKECSQEALHELTGTNVRLLMSHSNCYTWTPEV